jgi:hypothetical protein
MSLSLIHQRIIRFNKTNVVSFYDTEKGKYGFKVSYHPADGREHEIFRTEPLYHTRDVALENGNNLVNKIKSAKN